MPFIMKVEFQGHKALVMGSERRQVKCQPRNCHEDTQFRPGRHDAFAPRCCSGRGHLLAALVCLGSCFQADLLKHSAFLGFGAGKCHVADFSSAQG